MGLVAPGQVVQHVDVLLAAGRHHRQDPLHEPAPRLAVGPAAASCGRSPRDAAPARRRCSSARSPRPARRSTGASHRPATPGTSPPSWSRPHVSPRRRSSRNENRMIATFDWKVARAIVPSRTRCHQSNSRSEWPSSRRPTSADSPPGRSSPGSPGRRCAQQNWRRLTHE